MKVYLFNDSRSQNNWGCRATTNALLMMLAQQGHEVVGSFILERLTQLSTGRSPGAMAVAKAALNQVPSLRRKVRNAAWNWRKMQGAKVGYLTSIDDFEKFAARIESGKIWKDDLAAMRAADVILVNGEGSIYGTEQKGFLTLFICWFARTRLKKPCALVNHTATLSDPQMRAVAEVVYPMLDDVSFREPISLEANAKLAPQISDTLLVPDAAFSQVPSDRTAFANRASLPGALDYWPYEARGFDPSRPYLCVLGSSALGRPEQKNQFPTENFKRLVEGLQGAGHRIVMVASDTADEAPLGLIAQDLSLPFFPAMVPTPDGADILGNAACLVGGRWHPAILAARGGTPSVVFSANTTKTTALMRMLELSDTTFDATAPDQELSGILGLVDDYLVQGDRLRTRLTDISTGYGAAALDHIRLCKAA